MNNDPKDYLTPNESDQQDSEQDLTSPDDYLDDYITPDERKDKIKGKIDLSRNLEPSDENFRDYLTSSGDSYLTPDEKRRKLQQKLQRGRCPGCNFSNLVCVSKGKYHCENCNRQFRSAVYLQTDQASLGGFDPDLNGLIGGYAY